MRLRLTYAKSFYLVEIQSSIPNLGIMFSPAMNISIISAVIILISKWSKVCAAVANASIIGDTDQLRETLIERCPSVISTDRPVAKYSETLNVDMAFGLIKFLEISDTRQT